jgi:diguanylate cyclase (GGDEF)-like protein
VSENLLIIEDSPAISKVIERIGTSLGYTVTIAHSFAEVKKLLATNPNFYVATIDFGLPDAPNGEVIPFVLEHKIPSIIMTGRMDDATRKKILNLPVVDYITKENAQAYHYLLRVLNSQLTNKNVSVLVVDDSLTARNHTCQLLRRRNFTVYDVPDGTKALQILEAKPEIKIVITDHEMPGMSGVELLQKIRKQQKNNELIVIGVSGTDRDTNSAKFIKNGADDFLQKPLFPEEFYCRIMQHIEKLQYLEKIELAANQDYLTSLYNRRCFLDKTSEALKAVVETPETHALASIFINDFKTVNEKHGHEIADLMLVEFANLLKKELKGQLTARFGGAEFAAFISVENIDEAKAKLDVVITAAQKLSVKGTNIKFSINIGVIAVDASKSMKELLKVANDALTTAKGQGVNKLVLNA